LLAEANAHKYLFAENMDLYRDEESTEKAGSKGRVSLIPKQSAKLDKMDAENK